MAKTGLGRGLGSLLGARPSAAPSEPTEAPPEPTPAEDSPAGPGEVPVGEILPGAMQPRSGFDDESLNELAESIRENGIMQPLVVRPREGGYELIAGERRWRASQMAGLARVPVIVRDVDDQTALELALIENLQREDLDPIENPGYAQLMDQFDLTQEEVATRVGKNRATVANALRLAKLPAEVQAYVRDGMLSSGHAKVILGLKDAEDQVAAAKRVIKKELSVRATEDLVVSLAKRTTRRPSAATPSPPPVRRTFKTSRPSCRSGLAPRSHCVIARARARWTSSFSTTRICNASSRRSASRPINFHGSGYC